MVDVPPLAAHQSCMHSASDLPATAPAALIATEAILRATLEVALASVAGPVVLAVSGGRDSMVLLQAMARWMPERIAAVATFDHGTGEYATEAASLVAAESRRLGLTVVRERARTTGRSEAEWRAARWAFLDRVARAFRARVATAHTRDDQLETVVMRLLRGAGVRGLAALAAPSRVVRPWLSVSRAELSRWAVLEKVPFLDDPMNASSAFLRARLRHELLPALEAATPGFGDAMLETAERAAAWRRDVEALVDRSGIVVSTGGDRAAVPVTAFRETSASGHGVLWPAVCARAGVTLDARGTQELVRFTTAGRIGAHVTVAGGGVILRREALSGETPGERFEVRCAPRAPRGHGPTVWKGTGGALPPRFGRFRWRRLPEAPVDNGAWVMGLPRNGMVELRDWNAGDRIRTAGAPAGRRVTRYFSEASVPALDRSGWPVVLVDDELVWVPGVCRSHAAPSRPGWPDLIWYRCEPECD